MRGGDCRRLDGLPVVLRTGQTRRGFDAGSGEEDRSARSGYLSKFRVGPPDLTGVAATKTLEQIIAFLDDTMLEQR